MKLKKIIAAILGCAVCLSAFTACGGNSQSLSAIKKSGKMVMYTNAAFPPFEYKDSAGINGVSGVDVDIAKEIAKDIGVELEIQDIEFTSALAAVQNGKGAVAIAGISVKPEREKVLDFSIPYVTSVQYIIVPKDAEVSTIEDLAGKAIGVQTGTTGDYIVSDEVNGSKDDEGNAVTGVLQDSGATVKGYTSAMNAAQDIQAGRLDAVVIDKMPAESICNNNPDLKCLELVYADGTKTNEEYAIAVQKGNKELLDQVNKTIQRLIDEGKIDEYIINHTTK